jgi:hypothetical protein
MRLNRVVTTQHARFESLARTPSGAAACVNNNNANNNRTRQRVGDQA